MRVISNFDNKGIGDANKSFKSLTRTWDRAQKRAQKTGLFSIGLMKDRRQVRDVNNMFGKLKMTLAETMQEYNTQLDLLSGKRRDFGDDSEYKSVQNNLEKAERKVQAVTKAYDKLVDHRDRLEQEKESLSLLPSVSEIQTKQVKLQTLLDNTNKKIAKLNTKAFSNNMDLINTKIKDATDSFDIIAKKSASLKFMDDDNTNWNKLKDFVKGQDDINKYQEQTLTEQINSYRTMEQELIGRLDEALKRRKTKNNKEIISSLSKDLEDTRHEIDLLQDQLNILDINKKLVKSYKSSMNDAYSTKGVDYNSWKKGRDDLKRNTDWQISQQSRLETFAIDSKNKVIPDSTISQLIRDKERIKTELLDIKRQRRDALKNDTKKQDLSQQLENTNIHIDSVSGELETVNAETEAWKTRLQEVTDEVVHINEQINILIADTKKNPTEQILKSEVMQKYNKQLDEQNRKWGALGGFASRFKARLAGIKGYMKQTTFFTRVWHKVWQNIYSQIASLINPLNIFRRAWDGWINQYENLALKNTFDVIKFNLIRVLKPFLEWVAKMLLKLAAIVNVFTKKWFGIDLFDKTLWQTEKMKNNMKEMTASFDELHDNNVHPDEYNTIFDQGNLFTESGGFGGELLDPDKLLNPDFVKTLEGIADNIKNWWDDVTGWIKEHPLLAGALALGALALPHLLGSLLGSIIGLALKGLGKLGGLVLKGVGTLAKGIWNGLKWLGPKLWSGAKTVFSKIFNKDTWKNLWTGIKNVGSKIWTGAKKLGSKLWNGAKTVGSKVGTFLNKGLYTGMNGAEVTMGKFIGGIGLVASGVTLAGTQAAKAGKNWQDYNGWQKAGAVGAVGLGSAMAGVGAVMLGASGPVGWAVAGAVALGSLVIGMSQTQNGLKGLKEETEEWQKANENMQQALVNVEQANQNYITSLARVKELEEETGRSGEELVNSVDSGKESLENLTLAELNLYYQYKNTRQALQQLNETRKEAYKAIQEEAKQKTDMLIEQGKETKSYDELLDHIVKCWKNGTMSTEEAKDKINRALVDMDLQSRITFIQNLPANLREGLDPNKYESGMNKLGNWLNEKFGKFVDGIKSIFGIATNELSKFTGSTETLAEAENNLTDAHTNVENKTNALNEAEQKAGITYDELMKKVQNGEIEYGKYTEAQQAVIDTYNDLQTAEAEERESLRLTGEQVAGVAYQALKSSGDYKKFIETLKKANQDGKISTQDMNKAFGEAMSDMNSSEQKTFKAYIQDLGLGTTEAEKACKESQGIFQRWANSIKGFFSDVGQKFKNLFGGNGFKTDLQVQNQNTLKGASEEQWRNLLEKHPNDLWDVIQGKKNINSLAVGTNYVPNDQLAYIHQGEAVIPKKYNKPYKPDDGSSGILMDAINSLTNQVSQITDNISKGIPISGQFVQRGADLVATVERASNKVSNGILNNKVYAR